MIDEVNNEKSSGFFESETLFVCFISDKLNRFVEFLKSFFIECIPLDEILFESRGCPLAEFRCSNGVDSVSNREDHI